MNSKTVFKRLNIQELVLLGMFVAIGIILGRFSVGPTIVKVGLGFIGTVLLAYEFGPFWGAIGAMTVDLLSSAIFGNQGGFFIGFTISAIVAAIIYGLFLYQQPLSIWRVVLSTLLVTLIVNIFLNTLWLTIMYRMNLYAALSARIVKELIAPWIQMVITYIVLEAVSRVKIKR